MQALRLEARKLKRESEALDLVVDRSVSFLFSRSRSRLLCMRACAACVHVHVRARACVHACVCACGHACACVGDLEMDDRRPFHYDTPRVSPTSPGTVPQFTYNIIGTRSNCGSSRSLSIASTGDVKAPRPSACTCALVHGGGGGGGRDFGRAQTRTGTQRHAKARVRMKGEGGIEGGREPLLGERLERGGGGGKG